MTGALRFPTRFATPDQLARVQPHHRGRHISIHLPDALGQPFQYAAPTSNPGTSYAFPTGASTGIQG